VDDDGTVGLLGVLPDTGIAALDIEQMQILYYHE
jgi:hypothetical protein